jgi:hypothetical protein
MEVEQRARRVTAVDPFGQLALGYAGTVTFSSPSCPAILRCGD